MAARYSNKSSGAEGSIFQMDFQGLMRVGTARAHQYYFYFALS